MASESREEPGVGVDVPGGLTEWLDEQATALGVERDELVAQILASYHAAATMDGQLEAAQLLDLSADDFVDVETAVDDAVDDTVADRVESAVAARVEDAVEERLDAELSAVESEFQEKIEDVRERVIQVKQETDARAPADHAHDEFEAVDAIDERVDDLAAALDDLEATVSESVADADERFDDVDDRLDEHDDETTELAGRVDDAEEKLHRVAWVVSDLKDEATGRDAHEQAVDRIKRAAAQEGIDTATCERCDEAVHVALMTDPECPHCNATVSDVRPDGGIFRKKARLVAASQLESGEEPDDA